MTDNFTSFSHTILTYRSGTALVLMLNLRFVVVRKSSHLVHLVSTSGKKTNHRVTLLTFRMMRIVCDMSYFTHMLLCRQG